MDREVQYTDRDIALLLSRNSLAAEQLKGIILERLLAEAETKLSAQNGSYDKSISEAIVAGE